nr:hypothetical protein [Desulfobacterales bacterium]
MSCLKKGITKMKLCSPICLNHGDKEPCAHKPQLVIIAINTDLLYGAQHFGCYRIPPEPIVNMLAPWRHLARLRCDGLVVVGLKIVRRKPERKRQRKIFAWVFRSCDVKEFADESTYHVHVEATYPDCGASTFFDREIVPGAQLVHLSFECFT